MALAQYFSTGSLLSDDWAHYALGTSLPAVPVLKYLILGTKISVI